MLNIYVDKPRIDCVLGCGYVQCGLGYNRISKKITYFVNTMNQMLGTSHNFQ